MAKKSTLLQVLKKVKDKGVKSLTPVQWETFLASNTEPNEIDEKIKQLEGYEEKSAAYDATGDLIPESNQAMIDRFRKKTGRGEGRTSSKVDPNKFLGKESSTPADEVVNEIKAAGGDAVANYDSVATMDGGENIVKTALDSFGKLDIVVAVAGILRDRMLFNMTEEEWDAVIAVHLKGTFTVCKAASILFRQQRSGRIITFSSTSGLYGNSGQANYGAAKDGIAGFTRAVARDLGRYGVTVNSISPGAD